MPEVGKATIKPGLYWGWWKKREKPHLIQVIRNPGGFLEVFPLFGGDNNFPEASKKRDPNFPSDWHRLEPIPNPGRLK